STPGCSVVGDEKYGMINSQDNKGLTFNSYFGYFKDDVNFFSRAKSVNKGNSSIFNDINTSTSGLLRQNTGIEYSVEWTGFFVPNLSGIWNFKTNSDDASYVWIGNSATSGYSTGNALVKNPGNHPAKLSNEAAMNLDTNVHYPIRIQYGNGGGPDAFQFFMKSPNGSYTTDGTGLFFNSPPPVNSLAVYTIPLSVGNDNIGKVGYVTSDNKLKEYPSELIKKSNKYIEIGNFTNPGNDIKTINVKTADECMTGCNETDGCDGFVFNPTGTCSFKNSNMYPKTARIKSSGGDVLYKRTVDVKNNSSCSKNVTPISGSLWSNYIKDGSMTEDVLCNLGDYTKAQQEKVEVARKDLHTTVNEIHNKLNKLDENDKKLLNKYGLNQKKIEKDISMFNLANKQNKTMDHELTTLQGMQYNSETELISENYKNIVWSILAIVLVIGSIKLLK
ncbi:MAG: GLEYA domain-containing protein, partial [Candidatus Paceibacterota bacterium]